MLVLFGGPAFLLMRALHTPLQTHSSPLSHRNCSTRRPALGRLDASTSSVSPLSPSIGKSQRPAVTYLPADKGLLHVTNDPSLLAASAFTLDPYLLGYHPPC